MEDRPANASDSEEPEDNSSTPKKKKGAKLKVRDLIAAHRGDLAIPKGQDDMEVSTSTLLELNSASHCLIRSAMLTLSLPRALVYYHHDTLSDFE